MARFADRAKLFVGAIRGEHEKIVYAIEIGRADPDERDRRGWTPLMHAVRHGNGRSVAALRLHGAALTEHDANILRNELYREKDIGRSTSGLFILTHLEEYERN